MTCLMKRSLACRGGQLVVPWFLGLVMVSACFAGDFPAPRDTVGVAARAEAIDNAFTPAAPPNGASFRQDRRQLQLLRHPEDIFLCLKTPPTDFYYPDYIPDRFPFREEQWPIADNPYRYFRW